MITQPNISRVSEATSQTGIPKYTCKQKRSVVTKLFDDVPGKTQRWYAKHAGVSQAFVSYLWQERHRKKRPTTTICVKDINKTAQVLLEHFDALELIGAIAEATNSSK